MTKSPHQQRVEHFMHLAEQEVPGVPTIPKEKIRLLRAMLIMEEALETITAMGVDCHMCYPGVSRDNLPITRNRVLFTINETRKPDLLQVADGCADISVVTVGTLSAFGIHDLALLEEVDRSNLDKFKGDAHKSPEGKWIKPSDWHPPNIIKVLEDQIKNTNPPVNTKDYM